MEGQTYTDTNRYLFLFLIALMISCSRNDIQIAKGLNKEITVYLDYKDVTIPANTAPLNFSIAGSSKYCLTIKEEKTQLQVYSDGGFFEVPQKRWKALLRENTRSQTELTTAKRTQGEQNVYTPFYMDITNDPIGKYIAYRLLILSNDIWNRMGIYRRNLENCGQSVIYENSLTDYSCVSCHTFSSENPDKMIFHTRGKHAGSVLIDGKKITKLNAKTPEAVSSFTYMYWHPNDNYPAATVCDTYQDSFTNNPNTLEVLNHNSDIVIYDVKKNEVFFYEALNSKDAWQIFPVFSLDRKSLYPSSTAAVDSIFKNFRRITYSLCRVDFDPETRTLGQQVDTLHNDRVNHKSISPPKISPDGKYLASILQGYDGFSVWHKDVELYMIRLSDGKTYPLSGANNAEEENYHSWSHNNRWLVSGSHGLDGLYIRPFFTYIGDKGTAHRPFLLPRKNLVKYHKDLLWTHNLPEFIQKKAQVDTHAVMGAMKNTKGIQVK